MLGDKPEPDLKETLHLKEYSEAQTTGVIRKSVNTVRDKQEECGRAHYLLFGCKCLCSTDVK